MGNPAHRASVCRSRGSGTAMCNGENARKGTHYEPEQTEVRESYTEGHTCKERKALPLPTSSANYRAGQAHKLLIESIDFNSTYALPFRKKVGNGVYVEMANQFRM